MLGKSAKMLGKGIMPVIANKEKGYISIQIMISTWEIGIMITSMASACIYLLMEMCIKDFSKMAIILKGSSYMRMGMCMKDSLRTDAGMGKAL